MKTWEEIRKEQEVELEEEIYHLLTACAPLLSSEEALALLGRVIVRVQQLEQVEIKNEQYNEA